MQTNIFVAVLFVILLLGTSFATYQYTSGIYSKRELKIEQRVNEELRKQTELVLQKQQELFEFQADLESKYATQNEEINRRLSDYSKRIDNGFRLLDKHASRISTSSSNTGTSSGNNGTSGGAELSREATEFLLQLAGNADRVVNQLLACQEYVIKVKETINDEK